MSLAKSPPAYSREDQDRLRSELDRRDGRNRKVGRDIELTTDRLIINSPNGTAYALTVADDGTLGTALA